MVDALIGIPTALQTLDSLSGQGVGVSMVSFGKIFEGAFGAPNPAARLARFRAFLERFTMMHLSDPIQETFAQIRSDLRRHGQLIPDLDLLIASAAIRRNLTLITRNARHFGRIPDLTIFRIEGSDPPRSRCG